VNEVSPRSLNRGWVCALTMLIGTVIGASASAQTNTQIDLNQFRPAELATDGFATSTPDDQGHLRFGFQVWLDYADDPLKVDGVQIVHQQLTGHLVLSLGLIDRIVIFIDTPYHFIIREGDGLPALNGNALGDLCRAAAGVHRGLGDGLHRLPRAVQLGVGRGGVEDHDALAHGGHAPHPHRRLNRRPPLTARR